MSCELTRANGTEAGRHHLPESPLRVILEESIGGTVACQSSTSQPALSTCATTSSSQFQVLKRKRFHHKHRRLVLLLFVTALKRPRS
jgi:hypothetical protein